MPRPRVPEQLKCRNVMVTLPEWMIRDMDIAIDLGMVDSRSAMVREAVRTWCAAHRGRLQIPDSPSETAASTRYQEE